MTSVSRTRSTVLVAVLLLLAAGALLFTQSTKAQPPTDRDAVLRAEIAAVQRDVAGAPSGAERASAEAKLAVLVDEITARDAASAKRPATQEEDAAKRAALQAASKQAAAESAGYSAVIRATETGELMKGMPWNINDQSFTAAIWWEGPRSADGNRLAVWAGGFRGDSSLGGVLARLFLDNGDGTVIKDLVVRVTGHGPVSIIDEHGGVLELKAADGTALAFDTKSLSFR